ncbi:MAG: hypothetical protein NTW79_02660 [Candidatus Berkelbacteria bacterium]|nr:hypothetical protein [Candidatus Berkelbacteria bacterium]
MKPKKSKKFIIEIPKFFDCHRHLRGHPVPKGDKSEDILETEMLGSVTTDGLSLFSRVVVMPNTNPPVRTAGEATIYKKRITGVSDDLPELLLTIQITEKTTSAIIEEGKKSGVFAGKVYPASCQTNAVETISDFSSRKFLAVLKKMERLQMPLLIHCDDPFVFDGGFMSITDKLMQNFPNLLVVLEHIARASV